MIDASAADLDLGDAARALDADPAVSRLLCDARILSVFEGNAEIQADIIARGLAARR